MPVSLGVSSKVLLPVSLGGSTTGIVLGITDCIMRRNITGNVLGIINGNIRVIITSTFWGIINGIMKGMIRA